MKAWDLSKAHSDPYLFNHSVRSWLFAAQIALGRGEEFDEEVLAIGCLLHDIGLTKGFEGPNRFEIEGANAARSFVRELLQLEGNIAARTKEREVKRS
jgi:HD superfamily phosphodiesterase